MDFENLSDELKAKAKNCRTPQEMLELAAEEGYELTEEELESVSGGSWSGGGRACDALHCTKDECDDLSCGTYYSTYSCDLECSNYTTTKNI